VSIVRRLIQETVQISLICLKIMIPVSILIKGFSLLGVESYLANLFYPLMSLVGLPGECGIAWASAILTGVYGGVAAFNELAPSLSLTSAQVSIWLLIIVMAHLLLVELRIGQKAGISLLYLGVLRIGGALLCGAAVYHLCAFFNFFQEPFLAISREITQSASLLEWIYSQLYLYIKIVAIIFFIVALLRGIEKMNMNARIGKWLTPVLSPLGIGHHSTSLMMVGFCLGITYGGGFVIQEARSGKMSKKETFAVISFLSIAHALIEETVIMALLGGKVIILLGARVLSAWIFTWAALKGYDTLMQYNALKWRTRTELNRRPSD